MFSKIISLKPLFFSFLLTASLLVISPAHAAYLVVSASGTPAGGIYPKFQVYVNGVSTGGVFTVGTTLKSSYIYIYLPTVSDNYKKGDVAIDIAYINDGKFTTSTGIVEDRNLIIKSVSIIGVTYPSSFAGQSLSLPSYTIPTDSIRYDRGYSTAAFDDKDVVPFAQSAPNVPVNGALRFKLSTGLTNTQMGLVVNDNDPYSVEIGKYYMEKRSIPVSNIVHVKLPVKTTLTATEFDFVKKQIDAQLPKYVQAMALAWTQPYAVECNSITSAVTLGFRADQCKSLMSILPENNPYYASKSKLPFTDYGIRPSMLLAAYDVAQGKALIDKGLSSNKTYPNGTSYLMNTSDAVRRIRATYFNSLLLGKVISPYVNVTKVSADYIQKPDILFYFQGLAKVPNIGGSNIYLPGAIADNLTSFGGVLDGTKGQTVILDFIKAGATGSFGTVSEPAAYLSKFPDPRIIMVKYASGETLIESYWKSVLQPYQGLFVGDPLASPWETIVPVLDKIAPTVPKIAPYLKYTDVSVNLIWEASIDNQGSIVKYKIYRDGVLIKNANETTYFTDSGLKPSTTYSYTVAAYDESGNVSAKSAPVSVTTLAKPPLDVPIGGSSIR